GPVHGKVRVLEQGWHIHAIPRVQAHPDAAGDVEFVLLDAYGLRQAPEDALHDQLDIFEFHDLVQYQHEFVAALTRDGIAVPDGGGKPLGDVLQYLVADLVAQAVVDVLE